MRSKQMTLCLSIAASLTMASIGAAQLTPEDAEPAPDKIMVCHLAKSDGFFEPVEVSTRSLKRHLGHGDCVIDDGVDCTIDVCDPDAGCLHIPDDSVCDDGVFCNGVESCSADGCVALSACPPVQLECGLQACDEENDACVIIPNDAECDDANPCTTDVCTDAGTCASAADDTNSCDDGVFCNGAERCDAGSCVRDSACPETPLECGSRNCDEGTDACNIVPRDADCPPCSRCSAAGTCEALDCGEDEPCTTKSCDPDLDRCVSTSVVCDDGNPCTTDACEPGVGCRFTPVVCDDGIDCTVDSCDRSTGACVSIADDARCDDGAFCNGAEVCNVAAGGCRPGPCVCCNDTACYTQSCNEATDSCEQTPTPACTAVEQRPCSDGLSCTTGDTGTFDICTGELCAGTCEGSLTVPCPCFGLLPSTWMADDVKAQRLNTLCPSGGSERLEETRFTDTSLNVVLVVTERLNIDCGGSNSWTCQVIGSATSGTLSINEPQHCACLQMP